MKFREGSLWSFRTLNSNVEAAILWLIYIDGDGLGYGLSSDSQSDGYIIHYYTFYIAQTWIWIPTPYFCTWQESESESVSESVSGNVNEPWHVCHLYNLPVYEQCVEEELNCIEPPTTPPPKKTLSKINSCTYLVETDKGNLILGHTGKLHFPTSLETMSRCSLLP